MRKNGLTGGLIVTTKLCSACNFIQAKEEIVFYVVLLVIVFVLVGGAFAVLVIENFAAFGTTVQLSFFTWHTPSLPVGLWLLISCLTGALIVYLLSIPIALKDRRELRILRMRVKELEQAQSKGEGVPGQVYPPIVPMPGISPGQLPPSTPPQI